METKNKQAHQQLPFSLLLVIFSLHGSILAFMRGVECVAIHAIRRLVWPIYLPTYTVFVLSINLVISTTAIIISRTV